MVKKLSAIGNSLGIIIEKPILDLLDIDRTTDLEVKTDGDALIIRPVRIGKKERWAVITVANYGTVWDRNGSSRWRPESVWPPCWRPSRKSGLESCEPPDRRWPLIQFANPLWIDHADLLLVRLRDLWGRSRP